jgi:CheY-like chemotaxis protein
MRYSLATQSKPWIDSMSRDANARRLFVMVVDDNRNNADSLAEMLRLKGHNARVAYSGAQALVIVRVWRPDVAILDVDMDGVRGVELASGIRKTVAGPIMLVAVTGAKPNGEVAPMSARAFDHVFLKPMDKDDLLRLLGESCVRVDSLTAGAKVAREWIEQHGDMRLRK